MSKRANPVVIGGFVLGALLLGLGGLIAFGSGLFRQDAKETAVAYFDGSVSGLSVGAPVTFRGVRIGQVRSIQLQLMPGTYEARIPVELEIDRDKLSFVGPSARSISENLHEAIDKGLRAQLQMQSFVTGLVSVNLDFFPAAPPPPPLPIGPRQHRVDIPTMRSSIDSLLETVGDLPLQDLAGTALALLTNLNELLTSAEVKSVITNTARSAEALEQTATAARDAIGPLGRSLEETLAEARVTLHAIQQATKTAQADVSGLMGDSRKLAQDADKQLLALAAQAGATLKALEQTVQSANGLLGPASAQRADLDQILRNLTYATRSLRGFAEQVERNPNALFLGKR